MHRRTTIWTASLLLASALIPLATAGAPSGAPAPVAALEHEAPPGEDRLDHGLAVVDAATDVQLDRAGLAPAPAAEDPAILAPSEAAAALLASTPGAPAPAAVHASLEQLDALPASVADALADVLVAYHALTAASQDSFATLEAPAAPAGDTPGDVWAAQGVDPGPALAARASLLAAVDRLDAALAASQGPTDVDVHLAPALAVDLTEEDDVYTEDVGLLVDAGGDDVYENNAGGTGTTFPGASSPSEAAGFPAAALVDLDGADTYGDVSEDPWERRSAANGGAFAGVGLLVDDGGHDTYAAYADGVNGGAFLGVGLLLDTAGDDVYDASGWGANGGGYPGAIGQLVDLGGDDAYTGSYEAVNGGGAIGGSGLLYDGGGQDAYEATRAGTNGGGWGGQGLLVDRGTADDTYTAEGEAVNGGAFGGTGLLYDEGGTDTYDDGDGANVDETLVPKGAAGAQVDG